MNSFGLAEAGQTTETPQHGREEESSLTPPVPFLFHALIYDVDLACHPGIQRGF